MSASRMASTCYFVQRCYAFSIFLLFSYSLHFVENFEKQFCRFQMEKKKDNHIVTWKIINIVEVVIVDFKIVINIFE